VLGIPHNGGRRDFSGYEPSLTTCRVPVGRVPQVHGTRTQQLTNQFKNGEPLFLRRGLRNAFVINLNWALIKASKQLLQRASVTSLVLVVVVGLIPDPVPRFWAGMLVSVAAAQRCRMHAALRRDPQSR